MLEIFLAKNFTYLRSAGLQPNRHAHIAPQISIAARPHLLASSELSGEGLYFAGEESHSVTSDGIMHTFLVNPVIPKARLLSRVGPASLSFRVPDCLAEQLENSVLRPSEQATLNDLLDLILNHLLRGAGEPEPLDQRIAEALEYIDDLEQKRIAAGELAEQLALSESRFLHLFKAELQTTVRKYLLWLRTGDGVRMVVEGASITEAAHATGFTDSAHFARVFKQMFGLTLSAAVAGEPRPKLVVENRKGP